MKTPAFLQIDHADPAVLRAELIDGLCAETANIAPKHFYDALGARLFSAITELPEYYPTRTEAAIFARHGEAMAAAVRDIGGASTWVDLGAGNCEKAARLFDLFGVKRYAAVDISVEYLAHALEHLQRRHPSMDLLGIGMDFSRQIALPLECGDGPRLIFYPGSSIGNFDPAESLRFLLQAHQAAQGGALLIGVDLVKPADILEAAYDDPLGVTAAFNRNLLLHVNRLIGSDFRLADWRHVAHYNGPASRIEMHLETVRQSTVRWVGGERRFAMGQRIHTENSYKWRIADFAKLLARAGFTGVRHWTDEREWFAVFLAGTLNPAAGTSAN